MTTIELTDDECNVLRAILYGGVGGPASGRLGLPRKIAEMIAIKVPWPDPSKYKATIQIVNKYDSRAVVITEVDAEKGTKQ